MTSFHAKLLTDRYSQVINQSLAQIDGEKGLLMRLQLPYDARKGFACRRNIGAPGHKLGQSGAFSHKQDEIKGCGGSFLEGGEEVEADVGRWDVEEE